MQNQIGASVGKPRKFYTIVEGGMDFLFCLLTPGAKSAGKAARPPFRPSFPCKTRLRKDIFKNKKNNRDIFFTTDSNIHSDTT